MIKVAIAGGAGYTAGELARILINHPSAELKYILFFPNENENQIESTKQTKKEQKHISLYTMSTI